ncbi:MAG TPA: phosphoglucosamine mutase [Pirellulales bacterium]|jgi:phosphomannomutase|nr:phosphoglucosamine mutase [Pirellulales bacterium]
MHEPIISVSGLRGIVGDSLTPLVALRYATAFAERAPAGPIVVTQDGRATGGMLADVIRGGLAAVGRDVIDAGIAATPTTGVLVRQFSAAGGIQISASHNPPEYNGMKLFSHEGRVVPAEFGQRVLAAYRDGQPRWVGHERLGQRQVCDDTAGRHLELVLATVDAERIRRRRFRVLLDSNHGSGSVLGRGLLAALGCQATLLGGEPDGRFAHTPEPLAENLEGVSRHVVNDGVDVGFCQDPDADRLALIDENGRYIGEEYTLAICVAHGLSRPSRKGPVITNCSTSRMTQDIAEKFGVPFFRSAVGEANVVDCMLAHGAVLGGEGNGGVIHPEVGYVRDSFVGMAMVLDAMAARDAPLSRLADELPRYEIVKTKVSLPADQVSAGLDRLAKHFREAQADRLDGLRLDWPGKWLLVRASNTEPIVRAIAEAPTRDEAQRLCDESAKVLSTRT